MKITYQPGYALAVRPRPIDSAPQPLPEMYRLISDLRPGPNVPRGNVIRAGQCVIVDSIEAAMEIDGQVHVVVSYGDVYAHFDPSEAWRFTKTSREALYGPEPAHHAMLGMMLGHPPAPSKEDVEPGEDAPVPAPKPKAPEAPPKPKQPPGTTRHNDPRNPAPEPAPKP